MTGLVPLLRGAASDPGDFDPTLLGESVVRWAVQTGLGPLIWHLGQKCLSELESTALYNSLRSTDLVAKLTIAETLDALEEILSASQDISQEITLLKGVSICQRHYPKPHLRTMGDIDLLVPQAKQEPLESLLSKLGYRQQSSRPAEFYRTHHHSMPYFHPARHMWVEVHTALLSHRIVATDPVFSSNHIASQIVPTTFRGYKTNRLSDELEVIYIAAHWALERKCFAGSAIPLVDMMYLILKHGHGLNWDQLLVSIKGSAVSTHLFLMLGFLNKHKVIPLPQGLLERLAGILSYPLGVNEAILHALIDRYSMRGEAFGKISTVANVAILWETLLRQGPAWKNLMRVPASILFPPMEPRRFSLPFQLARISRAFGFK